MMKKEREKKASRTEVARKSSCLKTGMKFHRMISNETHYFEMFAQKLLSSSSMNRMFEEYKFWAKAKMKVKLTLICTREL